MMQIKKYLFPSTTINQMNMNFKIEIATTNPDSSIMEQLNSASDGIAEMLAEVDRDFSLFKYDSLVSRFQRGDNEPLRTSNDFKLIYDSAILAEQMTAGLYMPYFAGKYDPSDLVKGWAIERAFEEYLEPLLKNQNIDGIWLSGGGQIKVATKSGSDFRWSIDIRDSEKENEIVTTYYLKNGVISLQENIIDGSLHKNQSGVKQAIIVGTNLVETAIWALVATSNKAEKFLPFVERYNLSGILIDKVNEPLNFSKGLVVCSKEKLS